MKIKFHNLVGDDVRSLAFFDSSEKVRDSSPRLLQSQHGVALIVTLILLSVTLLMALAFLAVSRRERGSVTTASDTTTAHLAADAALAQAEAQVVSSVLATTNPYNSSLLVSTNYINSYGYYSGISGYDPTNVNYDYDNNGNPLTAPEFLQNIANLFYSPRAPVFIPNPTNSSQPPDFRFYLDLNRNGIFDTNNFPPGADAVNSGPTGDPEWIGVLEHPDAPHGPNNRFIARYAFIAVPADGALDLNAIHNQTKNTFLNPIDDGYFRNQGVGTWEDNLAAFLADLNTNEWDPQGFGNNYLYNQASSPAFQNTGVAFADAFDLLTNRYAANYNLLTTANNYFTNLLNYPYNIDVYSDGPLQTTLDTNEGFFVVNNDNLAAPWAGSDNTNHFFTPEDLFNTNETANLGIHLQAIGEDYDLNGDMTTNNYNRYTFYRLLSQLGTDSSAESGKLNINYSNAVVNYVNGVATSIAVVPNAETNFVPWRPLDFFTAAADKLLRTYTKEWFEENPTNYLATYYGTNYPYPITNDIYGNVSDLYIPSLGISNNIPSFGITNIPVYVNGQLVYTPAVNRVLQLAANIYDATTTNFYPDVFRPMFFRDVNGNVFINGYEQIVDTNGYIAGTNYYGYYPLTIPTNITDMIDGDYYNDANVYGVPWIIGAKKGFPNFNEFSMECSVDLTRRLRFTRDTNSSPPKLTGTNVMYTMGIANSLGVECWNSYATNYYAAYYPISGIQIVAQDNLSMNLNNSLLPPLNTTISASFATNVWSGSVWVGNNGKPYPNSFVIPLYTNVTFLPESVYQSSSGIFIPIDPLNPEQYWETNVYSDFAFPPPDGLSFGLLTTNRLQVFMLDGNHVIDYVQFTGPDSNRTNLTAEIFTDSSYPNGLQGVWNTNFTFGIPAGIHNQIAISEGLSVPPLQDGGGSAWKSDPEAAQLYGSGDTKEQQLSFWSFLTGQNYSYEGQRYTNTMPWVDAPYAPTRVAVQYITWQANDPLVHYVTSDFHNSYTNTTTSPPPGLSDFNLTDVTNWITALTNLNLGFLNDHYQPWGGNPNPHTTEPDWDMSLKDPLAWRSDYWDFPNYKLPTVGWLGRVHRGTPWQTVYLKSPDVLDETNGHGDTVGTANWAQWTGDTELTYSQLFPNGQYYDAFNSAPDQDRLLFDLFSTAPDDNATRGQLSVNVDANDPSPTAGLAAWSALFSGVVALTNTVPSPILAATALTYTNFIISPAGPAGADSVVGQIVTNINYARATFTNIDGLPHVFEHVGDILAVPQLSQQSPFLNWNNASQQQYGISDEMYEWLPQQVMSLLRVSSSPRYVIYCYGQTLKPAPDGIVTSGGSGVFGLCTNYQVVAESAARVVMRVDDANTSHPHVVVESYNVLPPD